MAQKNSKRIIKYFQLIEKEFTNNLKKVKNSQNKKAIHNKRVAIKKIRALFIFLEDTSNKQFKCKENFKLYQKIFKTSGQIRDLQIQIQIIKIESKKFGLIKNKYLNHLIYKKKKETKSFNQLIDKLNVNKIEKKSNQIVKEIRLLDFCKIKDNTSNYLNQKLLDISTLSKKSLDNQKWHDIRTEVKQVLYNLELIQDIFGKNNSTKELIILLKEFGERLGIWHDRDIAYMQLKKFIKQYKLSKKEKKTYRLILKSIAKKA